MRLRVCSERCRTCIFRPGNLMHLRPGRVRAMVAEATRRNSVIPCHEFLLLKHGRDVIGPEAAGAVCRGFYDSHPTQACQVMQRLGLVLEIPPPFQEKMASG